MGFIDAISCRASNDARIALCGFSRLRLGGGGIDRLGG